mgnify:CR=1 FL=1
MEGVRDFKHDGHDGERKFNAIFQLPPFSSVSNALTPF